MTVVQGNPAAPIAKCGVAFLADISLREFSLRLRPLAREARATEKTGQNR
jgi:hypothetical protein